MGVSNHHIKQYECGLSLGGGEAGPDATLYLYGERRELLAAIAFRADAQSLAPASVQEGSGVVLATLPIAAYDRIVDMLRNERPVVLCSDPAAGSLRLTTGNEPVGEEELRRMFSWMYV